jgi:hypothetical protein
VLFAITLLSLTLATSLGSFFPLFVGFDLFGGLPGE